MPNWQGYNFALRQKTPGQNLKADLSLRTTCEEAAPKWGARRTVHAVQLTSPELKFQPGPLHPHPLPSPPLLSSDDAEKQESHKDNRG